MSQTTTPTESQTETARSILERARTGHEDSVTGADVEELVEDAQRDLYDGADRETIYEALLNVTTARIERDPVYKRVAADVFRQRYYRRLLGDALGGEDGAGNSQGTATSSDGDAAGTDAAGDFVDLDPGALDGYEFDRAYRETFVENLHLGVEAGRLDERLVDEDRFDLATIGDALIPERDEQLEYLAMSTLEQRYFLQLDGDDQPLELPQAFWMRVAMGLAIEEDDPTERALEFYEVLSTLRFTPSTPTLFHAGTAHPQLSSCYLTTVQDDLGDIFESYKHHAQLSKWSGGLGNDWTNLRAAGSLIESTGVESTGVVPFLRISNDVTAAINRSGKRRGAACAYLECWHLDFPQFLDLKRNTGDERRRTPDMNTAAWIPDLFMERVQAGEEWTLFSPDEVPDLHGTYGEAFAEQYEHYESLAEAGELRQYETVDAADLWRQLLTRLFETGHPWVTFKDPCNVRSPQDHEGVINSSNLCTEITLNTSQDEHAVCNLGSVNFANHVAGADEAATASSLDRDLLSDTVETAMRMLDDVVDLCFYPTDEAEDSNMRHRPVGLGTMGFHDALMELGVPMASEEAVEAANRWQEFVSYHAILNSSKLAKERGTYPSYAGSKWDRGQLPQDTVDRLEEERGQEIPTEREETMDWFVVREHVEEHGMRNSNTMAIAPTATVSTINGTTASIEPMYSNLYVKSNMSGDFTIVNDHLVEDLQSRDLWDEEMIDRIKFHDGSIQEIDRVPDELQELYRGAFEIDPRHQLRLTAHRQTWIDQSVSHNVFFPSTDGSLLDDVYTEAWELGLKTTYYLRTLGASQIEKSTLDMAEYGKTQHRDGATGGSAGAGTGDSNEAMTDGGSRSGAKRTSSEIGPDGGSRTDRSGSEDGSTELCSIEDPTCDACQ